MNATVGGNADESLLDMSMMSMSKNDDAALSMLVDIRESLTQVQQV